MRKIFAIAATTALMAVSAPATAATQIWLDSDSHPGSVAGSNGQLGSGVARTFTNGGVTVRATAWSIQGNSTTGTVRQAGLGVWTQGLGVDKGSPDNSHTTDNDGGYIDFIVLQFDKIVKLEDARFNTNSSWAGLTDSDATIGYDMAFGPNQNTALNTLINNKPASSLSAFSPYSSNVNSTVSNTRNINPLGKSGNVWLIGASFNNPSDQGRYNQKAYDGFKLEYLTYTIVPPGVPEPSTWAMMLLGFGFVGAAMRSARRKNDRILSRPREQAFQAA